jgi:outer membrane lipoprotein-sorting protein
VIKRPAPVDLITSSAQNRQVIVKHFAILASGLLAVALVPPALAQDNEAEKLFRAMEKKIRTAGAVEVAFTYQVEDLARKKWTTKGTLLLTKGNKARLKVSGYFGGNQAAPLQLVSDGKQLKTKGARFAVASNGVPGVEKGGQSEQETPKHFHVQLGALVSRGGMWFSLYVMPYLLRDGIDPDDEGSKVNAYAFKFGAAGKVGEREAKLVRYRFGKGGGDRGDQEIILWVDAKTLLPLKRVFDLRRKRGVVSGIIITERYNEFTLDPKIDAKAFGLPK